MAQIPAAAVASASASAGTSALASTALNFVVNLGASYLLSRLSAQDGPRLGNLSAGEGDYGVPMPRLGGDKFRLTPAFIAQDDIEEKKHTVNDHSTIVGAVTGAAQGFMVGGPVGAAVGAVVGGILGFAAPKQHYYTYSDTFAQLLADRTDDDPIEGLSQLWANGKAIFVAGQVPIVQEVYGTDGKLIKRKWGKNKYFTSLTLYTGHTEQGVDPVLAAAVGEDNAYVFSAYFVIEKLQLAAFGNSVPPTEALPDVKAGQKLSEFVEKVCFAAGIDANLDVSSTALVHKGLRGYGVLQESSCWDALKPLLPAFGVDAADVGGQIRFYERSQSLRATIVADDLGAYAFGDEPPPRFSFRRAGDKDLPQETALTFYDPARKYQPNTMASRRSEGSARSNVSTSLNLVLTADEGASAAALMHWDAWLGRTALGGTLMDSWIGLEAGLAYALPFGDQYLPYRITRKTRGVNGIIEFEALSDERVTYTASESGTSGTVPDDPDTTLQTTRLILMDMPILSDDHDDYGFYVAMGGSAADWPRGQVQVSGDGGATYATLIDSSLSAVMGDVSGVLPAGATDGLDDTLDTTSVLMVVLEHDGMELESITDADLDNWKNFGFVGKNGQGEYLQWKTATKVAPKTWDLTNLRRGRRGTDWAIATHGAGEEFVVLGDEGVFRIVYSNETQWGVPLKFRGVTLHDDDAEDAVVSDFTNTGEGKRPYSPIDVVGTWDGSNNLTIDCTARFRLDSGMLGIDDRDEVEVEITNATPVRTIIGSGTSVAYSAANQATDGIAPGTPVVGRIRRTSDVNNGRWRNFVLVGPLSYRADSTFFTADSTLITADAT